MEYLANAEEMRKADEDTIHRIGIPSAVLMERAALSLVEEIQAAGMDLSRVLIICGSGNNGGDGFAAARLLSNKTDVTLAFVGNFSSMTEECSRQRKICENLGLQISDRFMEGSYTLIIDAILGTGLSREVKENIAEVINWINTQSSAVASVDIPSGICADDGKILGTAVRADLTVTFQRKKIGQILYPGASFCGKLVCRDIGILLNEDKAGSVFTFERKDLKYLPKRTPYSNKGTYGKVLLVAGSVGMSGAALLSARAALKSGCGMVRVLTPECNRIVLQTSLPEAIVTSYDPASFDPKLFSQALSWADVVGIGPGLGTSNVSRDLLDTALSSCDKPMILDADALNLLAADPSLLEKLCPGSILTPHVGEMERLTKKNVKQIQDSLIDTACEFARKYHVILVLKDARSVVTDGERVMINTSGNDGMATAGSGDVLTGMISSLAAQKMEMFDAASLGVFWHGCAGDLTRDLLSERSMTAMDITDQIGAAARPGKEIHE